MKSRYLPATLAAAIGLALVGVPSASAAVKPNLTCGEVITASIILNTNLNCPDTAIVISNDTPTPIIVDLGGHTIQSPPTNSVLHSTIVAAAKGPTTVQNGRIVGGGGSNLSGGSHLYQNVTIDGGYIDTFADKHVVVLNSHFINGAGVTSSEDSVDIENSTFNGLASHGIAINVYATFTTVLNTTITGYGTGIAVGGDLASANFQGNHISGVHGDGIQIGGVDTVVDRVPGTISDNVSSNNAGDGIVLYTGSGIGCQAGTLMVSNNTTNNNTYDGIHVDPTRPPIGNQGLSVTLTANAANANANLGIQSPGSSVGPPAITVIDGGGNTAKGNANKVQCSNVVCGK